MAEALTPSAMRLAIIADAYPPMRSSGAIQLRDLSRELVRQGHQVSVFVATPGLAAPWSVEELGGVQVVRLRTARNKDVGLIRRTLAETSMPFLMLRGLRRSPLAGQRWDGVIWYSPTIFLGAVASALRRSSRCRGYLIVRDIFPEWMVDMGLMGRGIPYHYFRAVARYQYSVADVIGVQTLGNASYFAEWLAEPGRSLEVLHNWLAPAVPTSCSISLADTAIAGRKIFVYAGNMGVAQGMGVLLGLADRMRDRADVGFVFVGRGSAIGSMRARVKSSGLDNVLFFDEIDPEEIPGLYLQCHVGLIALDPRHRTHNIPGKFLSYMQAGLPVLAAVNAGNDIVGLISGESVGRVSTDGSAESLAKCATELINALDAGEDFRSRCKSLAERMFSVRSAAEQIVRALDLQGGA